MTAPTTPGTPGTPRRPQDTGPQDMKEITQLMMNPLSMARRRRLTSRLMSRPRILLAMAAPLALAAAVIPVGAATAGPATTRAPATASTATTTANTSGLTLKGLTAATYTVTLITGDQVRLSRLASGRYTVTAIGVPGNPLVDIRAQTSPAGALTALTATPVDAFSLIAHDQVDSGLFDVRYLLAHGMASTSATIPVTVQFAPGTTATQLESNAARLPHATVRSASSASGQVQLAVAPAHAAAFWAGLTKGTSPPTATTHSNLADGVAKIWLTGHQAATASSSPQDDQPQYTVTETITRDTGMPSYEDDADSTLPTYIDVYGLWQYLWGVEGPGSGQFFRGNDSTVCVKEKPATPDPLCTAWQITFSAPAGVYSLQGWGYLQSAGNTDHLTERGVVDLDVPQITVAGPTSVTINADNAQQFTATTPQPTSGYTNDDTTMLSVRSQPNGAAEANGLNTSNAYWAVPTPPSERATIGGYHLLPELALARPQITASVAGPGHQAVHLMYPCAIDQGIPSLGAQFLDQVYSCLSPRFPAHETLPLVDAGAGSASDFSKIDAHGKLVLIHQPGSGYPANTDLLSRAAQAGAAAVLCAFETSTDGIPVPLPDVGPSGVRKSSASPTPDIPVVMTDAPQAAILSGLLAKGPVSITVHDLGNSPYAYFLALPQEGGISASLHATFTSSQLAERTVTFHASSPGTFWAQDAAPVRPDDGIVGGNEMLLLSPTTREYYNLSPDLVWKQSYQSDPSLGDELDSGSFQVFDTPGTGSLDVFGEPYAPGALTPWTATYQAQPAKYLEVCASCRQGNTFYPTFFEVPGGAGGSTIQQGPYPAPDAIHLYDQSGQELAATMTYGMVTYQLPPQQQRYRLAVQYGSQTGGVNGSSSTWDFTSSEPATDQRPFDTMCWDTLLTASTDPCRADPLVFLHYDAQLSPSDTVAPGTRQIQVTGYHQDPNAPAVTSLKLWTSTDGGTTWVPAQVTGGQDGTFTVTYTVPASAAGGHISIKAQASDAAGNDIIQEMDDAYAVAAASGTSTGQAGPSSAG